MAIAKFNIGDTVSFMHNNQRILGKIIRLNQKSISVNTENIGQWLVAPNLLTKTIEQ